MTLAQRVMVMNKGIAEQIGTPVEVYEKPASRFVASFIGSPAMNLLDGRINAAGTHFELESGMALPINWYYRGYAGRKMTLGIRPEHIGLTSQADGGVPLVMDTLEMLGADNGARTLGRAKLVVRLPHQERRKQAARCGCICRKITCTYLTVKQDNEYEQLALPHIVAHRGGGKLAPENTGGN